MASMFYSRASRFKRAIDSEGRRCRNRVPQPCASVGTFVLTVVKDGLKKGSELELNPYSLAVMKQSIFNRNYTLFSILWKYNLKYKKISGVTIFIALETSITGFFHFFQLLRRNSTCYFKKQSKHDKCGH